MAYDLLARTASQRLGATVSALEAKRARVRTMLEPADALLSPMAGVSDLVFRAICRAHGADVTYCEFVSANGLLQGNQATLDLVELAKDEHPVGIQLFGSEPGVLAEAAVEAEKLEPDLIDINFGCPVKKVVKKNGGSALLCNVPLMEQIVRAVVAATRLPVTAKIRIGWSHDSLNHLEVTRMLEEAGVCAVTVHGRTRDQKFTGRADWSAIAQVKAVARVPIVGNGDVWTGEDFLRMKRETGCDAVMIARGAIGNPWIFGEVKAARRGLAWSPPTVGQVVDAIIDHLDREIALRGERNGILRMRRQMSNYLKGYPGVAELRRMVFELLQRGAIVEAFDRFRAEHGSQPLARPQRTLASAEAA
jgi:tRNA-dihydrouridine synthase B